jgi:hypothetical protein
MWPAGRQFENAELQQENSMYFFKAPFTISSNAFRAQKWSNLARDDVWRLRKTPPSVSFLVGWLTFTSFP